MSPPTSSAAVDPRLARLQRAQRRALTPRYFLEASLDWCRSLASPSGVAYLVSLICVVVQTILIDAFIITYLSWAVLVTLAVEIPLLIHLATYWREESAHRSAPSEWLAYSWVHAAKVVVLFCRVMPRLPSASDSAREESGEAAAHYSVVGINFDQLFTPTMLANLLLITPVFYALLMFRTCKAIFGKFTHRITVDLILHYDMLWHVVIDMVDQVDMFHYARLPELESADWLEGQKEALVRIQTVIPLFLFLSMVLQAQAFPGVIVDRWKLPQPAPAKEPERQETAVLARESSRLTARGSSSRPRRPMATLRERSLTHETSGSEVGRTASPSPNIEPMAPPPPPAPAFLQPMAALAGSPLPPPAGHAAGGLAVRAPSPLSSPSLQTPPLQPSPSVLGTRRADSSGVEPPLDAAGEERLRPLGSGSGSERFARRMRLPSDSSVAVHGSSSRTALSCRRMHSSPPLWTGQQSVTQSASLGLRRGAIHGGEVLSRQKYLRLEKDRRRRLLDVIQAIYRQNIIIARKRSAMISIFFVDIPFLTIRLWLWILLGSKYFPGLGVKNAICIILNGMQITLVRFADRAAFRDIQAQLVQYRVRFAGSGPATGTEGSPDCENLASQSPGIDNCPVPLTPSDTANSSRLSTPQGVAAEEGRLHGRHSSAVVASQHASLRRQYLDAERTVVRESVRSTGVCVHFWSLLLAFGAGFVLAKGEHFLATFIAWLQNRDPNSG